MREVRNRRERIVSVRPRSCVSDTSRSQSGSGEVLTITTASAIHQGQKLVRTRIEVLNINGGFPPRPGLAGLIPLKQCSRRSSSSCCSDGRLSFLPLHLSMHVPPGNSRPDAVQEVRRDEALSSSVPEGCMSGKSPFRSIPS